MKTTIDPTRTFPFHINLGNDGALKSIFRQQASPDSGWQLDEAYELVADKTNVVLSPNPGEQPGLTILSGHQNLSIIRHISPHPIFPTSKLSIEIENQGKSTCNLGLKIRLKSRNNYAIFPEWNLLNKENIDEVDRHMYIFAHRVAPSQLRNDTREIEIMLQFGKLPPHDKKSFEFTIWLSYNLITGLGLSGAVFLCDPGDWKGSLAALATRVGPPLRNRLLSKLFQLHSPILWNEPGNLREENLNFIHNSPTQLLIPLSSYNEQQLQVLEQSGIRQIKIPSKTGDRFIDLQWSLDEYSNIKYRPTRCIISEPDPVIALVTAYTAGISGQQMLDESKDFLKTVRGLETAHLDIVAGTDTIPPLPGEYARGVGDQEIPIGQELLNMGRLQFGSTGSSDSTPFDTINRVKYESQANAVFSLLTSGVFKQSVLSNRFLSDRFNASNKSFEDFMDEIETPASMFESPNPMGPMIPKGSFVGEIISMRTFIALGEFVDHGPDECVLAVLSPNNWQKAITGAMYARTHNAGLFVLEEPNETIIQKASLFLRFLGTDQRAIKSLGDMLKFLFPETYNTMLDIWEPNFLTIFSSSEIPWELTNTAEDGEKYISLHRRYATGRIESDSIFTDALLLANLAAHQPKGFKALKALIVANPRGDLQFAEHEAESIKNVLRTINVPCLLLMGQAATKKKILEELTQNDIIHFACHSTIDPVTHEQGLVLANGEILFTSEFPLLPQKPIIVLNVCGLEPLGIRQEQKALGDTFLQAGAMGVMATFWPIFDNFAQHIGPMYSELQFTTGSSALRAISLGMEELYTKHVEKILNQDENMPKQIIQMVGELASNTSLSYFFVGAPRASFLDSSELLTTLSHYTVQNMRVFTDPASETGFKPLYLNNTWKRFSESQKFYQAAIEILENEKPPKEEMGKQIFIDRVHARQYQELAMSNYMMAEMLKFEWGDPFDVDYLRSRMHYLKKAIEYFTITLSFIAGDEVTSLSLTVELRKIQAVQLTDQISIAYLTRQPEYFLQCSLNLKNLLDEVQTKSELPKDIIKQLNTEIDIFKKLEHIRRDPSPDKKALQQLEATIEEGQKWIPQLQYFYFFSELNLLKRNLWSLLKNDARLFEPIANKFLQGGLMGRFFTNPLTQYTYEEVPFLPSYASILAPWLKSKDDLKSSREANALIAEGRTRLTMLCDLGEQAKSERRFADAIFFYRKAWNWAKCFHDQNSFKLESIKLNCAFFLVNLGRFDEAEFILEEILNSPIQSEETEFHACMFMMEAKRALGQIDACLEQAVRASRLFHQHDQCVYTLMMAAVETLIYACEGNATEKALEWHKRLSVSFERWLSMFGPEIDVVIMFNILGLLLNTVIGAEKEIKEKYDELQENSTTPKVSMITRRLNKIIQNMYEE